MFTPYIDLHCHTTRSDGRLTPAELVCQARAVGIRVLSITDHNYTENLDSLRRDFPDMTLIQGAEISCLYNDSVGKEHELHVVALGFDPKNTEISALLDRNRPDRRPYINAILARLRKNGIDFGIYEDIQSRFPEMKYIGRMTLARCLFEDGYTSSIDQGFDIYLGAHGQRRAYVENNLRYASLEETIRTIVNAGGIPVLAHLSYYKMDKIENERLVRYFKSLAGDRGAMEVYYSRYSTLERLYLLQLCKKYDLMISAASDYHAQEQWERLDTRFSYTACHEILDCLGIQVENAVPPTELLVLSGFSGAGKGTICKKLKTINGKPVSVIRSVTTRAPRSADDDYTFISKKEFLKLVKNHQMLEYNISYGGNGYGTPIAEVQCAIEAGAVPCLEIDRVGLVRLLSEGKVDPNLVHAIFVAAPAKELENRLRRRGTEDESAIRARLQTAMEETKFLNLYDAVIVNDDLETAVLEVSRAFEGIGGNSAFNAAQFRAEMSAILDEM